MKLNTALKKLKQLLGSTAGYRVNDKAPTAEEREAAKAALPAAQAERKRLSELLEARRTEVLAADAEYQRVGKELKAARDLANRLAGITMCHRITVGKSYGLFFSVMAEGDSWEEVFDKITAKKRVA